MNPLRHLQLDGLLLRAGLPFLPAEIAIPAYRAHQNRWDRALQALVDDGAPGPHRPEEPREP
ncbi:hypothetical protein [Marinactinospora rubrisoli]|uniref:Uncharacterized protein n=1 Tax=Marinactinospora rubrisoli TaxID=2715399 RepID=A0ABW2KGP6_9ACTN